MRLAALVLAAWPLVALADEPLLKSALDLSLEGLGPPRPDPSNRYAGSKEAAALGERLFFDKRFSSNGQVSCATCHVVALDYTDGKPLAQGVGTANRRTMPTAVAAYSPFLFWDGRKDSAWSQALGPLENPVEHGGTRALYARVVAMEYPEQYERAFGPLPDLSRVPKKAGPVEDGAARAAWGFMAPADREAVTRVFVNLGKAIAAYERTLLPKPSRFDRFVAEWKRSGKMPQDDLGPDERAGFAIFATKGQCTRCHNGPHFTNHEFHNTGVPARAGLPTDRGRYPAIAQVLADEFNCRSKWSDAKPGECKELDFLVQPSADHVRAYKVPTLRNVSKRAPYMHAGQFATLKDVLNHYNRAPAAPAGHTELKPLKLTAKELDQLEAFLRSLDDAS